MPQLQSNCDTVKTLLDNQQAGRNIFSYLILVIKVTNLKTLGTLFKLKVSKLLICRRGKIFCHQWGVRTLNFRPFSYPFRYLIINNKIYHFHILYVIDNFLKRNLLSNWIYIIKSLDNQAPAILLYCLLSGCDHSIQGRENSKITSNHAHK